MEDSFVSLYQSSSSIGSQEELSYGTYFGEFEQLLLDLDPDPVGSLRLTINDID